MYSAQDTQAHQNIERADSYSRRSFGFRSYATRLLTPFAFGTVAGWVVKENVFYSPISEVIQDALSTDTIESLAVHWNTTESRLVMGAFSFAALGVCGFVSCYALTKGMPFDRRIKTAAKRGLLFGVAGFVGGGIIPQFN